MHDKLSGPQRRLCAMAFHLYFRLLAFRSAHIVQPYVIICVANLRHSNGSAGLSFALCFGSTDMCARAYRWCVCVCIMPYDWNECGIEEYSRSICNNVVVIIICWHNIRYWKWRLAHYTTHSAEMATGKIRNIIISHLHQNTLYWHMGFSPLYVSAYTGCVYCILD